MLEKSWPGPGPDLSGDPFATFVDTLESAEADAFRSAPCGQASRKRVNQRNGHRDFNARADTLVVAIPKLGPGTHFPEWLPERRIGADKALQPSGTWA